MENKTLCQVCKKREAYKKLVSNLDNSFFVVCKKKKCIKELYDKFEDHVTDVAKTPEELVDAVRWDRMDHQGRTYKQMKSNMAIIEFVTITVITVGFALFVYGLFRLLFKF